MSNLPPEIAFLVDWLNWVNHGAPDGYPFRRSTGLCDNMRVFVRSEYACERLKRRLYADFYDTIFPFGHNDYNTRAVRRTMHQCPRRISWACKIVADFGCIHLVEKYGDPLRTIPHFELDGWDKLSYTPFITK